MNEIIGIALYRVVFLVFPACEDGFFSDDCTKDCHCDGSEVCHKATGACLGGLCAAGWKGENCQSGEL